jgi:hypothetical protein
MSMREFRRFSKNRPQKPFRNMTLVETARRRAGIYFSFNMSAIW